MEVAPQLVRQNGFFEIPQEVLCVCVCVCVCGCVCGWCGDDG